MDYFNEIDKTTEKEFNLAKQARSRGAEPTTEPEIYIATDLAEKVEGLVELDGVAEIVRKLSKKTDREEEVAFGLAREIIKKETSRERAADCALRAALAYLTQGAVAAPLEGIAKVKIKKNPDNTEYMAVYYAGPIRAAGGTAEALSVVVADYIREILGLSKYKPTTRELGRYIEEIQWYHRHVHLQYFPTAEEIRIIIQNTPVCIDGEPTEEFEVQNYRDLGRVETNRVRGGMCLVLAEGIAQKAPKLLKKLRPIEKKYNLDWSWLEGLLVKKATHDNPKLHGRLQALSLPGFEWVDDLADESTGDITDIIELTRKGGKWEWLDTLLEEDENLIEGGSKKYMQEIPAGRPVFSHPSRKGGFTLRYGRTRASGYAAVAVHPATMHILGDFIAIGTQIRLELPGKAAIVTPCDSINGPFVKLSSGEVKQINSFEEADKLKEDVDEILHLGDLLISAGDFLENNHELAPGAYCEEWWAQEVTSKNKTKYKEYTKQPYKTPPFKKALEISEKLDIPLHPHYTFFWHDITLKQLKALIQALQKSKRKSGKIELKKDKKTKEILENLGVFHKIVNEKIVIKEHSQPLLKSIGFGKDVLKKLEKESLHTKDPVDLVSKLSGLKIKTKSPTYVGARMGRPEKAKPRKMTPAPHVLFPTGGIKGRIRNIVKMADEHRKESPELAKFKCPSCNLITFSPKCPSCGNRTKIIRTCQQCKRPSTRPTCSFCNAKTTSSDRQEIDFSILLEKALKKLGQEKPKEVKGILGMISKDKIPEALEKGLLRAKAGIFVFKDGTIRFDSTNAPLTHFNPKEIGAPVEKLKQLGYTHDLNGKPLKNSSQLLELKPQDLIISDFGEESATIYLLAASKFVDELLEKYYKLKPYYKAEKKQDLIGKLVIALAPHTSTGIVGRIIGFTKARVGFAHPCFHDAKRRDCDGDEDAVMLLLDAFLNFSRSFLPEKRGGRMDAPLVITTKLNPLEIDDEVYDLDIAPQYSLEFYKGTEKSTDPNKVKIKTVQDVLYNKDPFAGWRYTHETSDINLGPLMNTYSKGEMLEKLERQLALAEKIKAVDEKDVAERIIQTHFIPDIKGNLRTFFRQKVRCTKCNSKYRRPPLSGICTKCGGNLTLTVHRGTIVKYLGISKQIARKYQISPYLSQQIDLLENNIESVFGREEQSKLATF